MKNRRHRKVRLRYRSDTKKYVSSPRRLTTEYLYRGMPSTEALPCEFLIGGEISVGSIQRRAPN